MYQDAMEGEYRPWAELVAFCDLNPGRVEIARQRSAQNRAPVPPGYAAADFARMIAETKPDIVVVTTVDEVHDDFIVRAMELGCDVITEKPMTHTAAKCRRILEARRRTGRSCRVSFNYRYSPPRSQVKDLLMRGEIGEVVSVDFHWLLNTLHGADYFRRWHSQKKRSGGLMVHKSTHHFDLVNWWLGAMPVSVYATGQRGSTRRRWRGVSVSRTTMSAAIRVRKRRAVRFSSISPATPRSRRSTSSRKATTAISATAAFSDPTSTSRMRWPCRCATTTASCSPTRSTPFARGKATPSPSTAPGAAWSTRSAKRPM
jgi:predicted dehydrogenase